jgi:hypothetical protein
VIATTEFHLCLLRKQLISVIEGWTELKLDTTYDEVEEVEDLKQRKDEVISALINWI